MKKHFFTLFLSITGLMIAGSAIAQTCNSNIKPTAPAYRFTINTDGTITDRWTELTWKRCPEGMTANPNTGACDGSALVFNWQNALNRARDVNAGIVGNNHGATDWRLPNLKELVSLTEVQCIEPARNFTIFPTATGGLWSSTPWSNGGIIGWFYSIDVGSTGTNNVVSMLLNIQLVRGF